MENLTKKQRNTIYKMALEEHLKTNLTDYHFLCILLADTLYLNFFKLWNEDLFPEFMLFKPVCNFPFNVWFTGSYSGHEIKEHQRTILEFCIEMTN